MIKEIAKLFKVNGENGKWATLYKNIGEIEDGFGKTEEFDLHPFEEKFGVDINELEFPVIVFDEVDVEEGEIFEAQGLPTIDDFSAYFDRK